MGKRSYTKNSYRTLKGNTIAVLPVAICCNRALMEMIMKEEDEKKEKKEKEKLKWEKKCFPDKVVKRIRCLANVPGTTPENIAHIVSQPKSVVEKILKREIRGDYEG